MRVGLVSADVAPLEGAAGTRQHVVHIAAELSRLGHDVRVYERRRGAALAPAAGYRVESVPVGPARHTDPGDLVPLVPEFGRWLAERWADDWTPDVVHGHHWIGGLAAASAARTAAIPVVQTFHTIGAERQRQLGRAYRGPGERIPLERALIRAVDMAVAQSTDEAEELARMGIDRGSVEVVPAGVDVAEFSPEGDAAPRHRRRRILSVNGFGPGSGQADLIRAMRLVGDAELVIAGAAPDEKKVRELVRASGVEEQVTLVGQVPHEQMSRWYRSADLVACAMRYATRGPAPLEAMACGVPVVGYALGGVADTVVDEVTGRLVRPGDVRGLGVTLRHLLADDATRFAFRHAAIDRVRCRYTWDRTAGALERLYTRVLGRRGRLATA
jgi:glycosyltransferase involved in cell wall biosynthesis